MKKILILKILGKLDFNFENHHCKYDSRDPGIVSQDHTTKFSLKKSHENKEKMNLFSKGLSKSRVDRAYSLKSR